MAWIFQRSKSQTHRVEEYWDWFTVALFLLLSVDLLTTFALISQHGLGGETNPIMVWLFSQGLLAVAGAHVVVAIVSTLLFSALVRMVQVTQPPYATPIEYLFELWLGLLLVAGIAIFSNNFAAIVHGQSLL
jgi:hypothetical protein